MKKLIALIVISLISLGNSFAQDNSYNQTLKKMLQVSGSEESFKAAIPQMIKLVKQQKSNIPDEIWNEFEKEFLSTSVNDLVEMLAPIYQKYLNESDLKAAIEFYQSPSGKKMAEKTPLIMQESMQVGQQWGMKIGMKIQEKLKEKGY